MNIPFFKMTGGGNDFVVFDNRAGTIKIPYDALAKKVCDRHFSVGGDGLLVLENSAEANFRMVYYNADGSRACMCGNGARCIAKFARVLNAAPSNMNFMTDAGLLSAEVKPNVVKLKMIEPKDLRLENKLRFSDGKMGDAGFINTGVPHAVILVNDIAQVNVDELGRNIRHHAHFAPAGTNVNFVQYQDQHHLSVRTYERGVEAETLACGTGIVASALICAMKGLVESPVSCQTRGGESMDIYFNLEGTSVSEVYLEGPAVVAFKGEIEL